MKDHEASFKATAGGTDGRPAAAMKVLLACPDRVAPTMAGTGIRYAELAARLAGRHDVVLMAPEGSADLREIDVRTYDASGRSLRSAAKDADVLFAPPLPPALLAGVRIPWTVDLYNPEPFEGLALQLGWSRARRHVLDTVRIDRISFALRSGGTFVCANERQRDMWLGYLAAVRRLDSDLYAEDQLLRSLIDVVPSGLPETPACSRASPSLRGRHLPADALILVWNGGMWDWLDPLTALRGLAVLREENPRWCLAFSSTARPSGRSEMAMPARAQALAAELGLGSDAVYFHPGAMPYADRSALLVESDVGLSLHQATLESRFAYRVRVLDYVWAHLPVLCTVGDSWAEEVERRGLGVVIRPDDPVAFAAAAREIVGRGREGYEAALRAVARESTWTAVIPRLERALEAAIANGARRRGPSALAIASRHRGASLGGAVLTRLRSAP